MGARKSGRAMSAPTGSGRKENIPLSEVVMDKERDEKHIFNR